MKARYFIDGDGGNERYNTIREIRIHVESLCKSDQKEMQGLAVCSEYPNGWAKVHGFIRFKSGKMILAHS